MNCGTRPTEVRPRDDVPEAGRKLVRNWSCSTSRPRPRAVKVPRDAHVHASCWSPDGKRRAFVWEPVRQDARRSRSDWRPLGFPKLCASATAWRRPRSSNVKRRRAMKRHAGNAMASIAIAALWRTAPLVEHRSQSVRRNRPKPAVAFLAAEVPRWFRENKCYSCHNNGDAARALLAALKSGNLENRVPLADTLEFLSRPERWDANGPEGPFKDKNWRHHPVATALVDAIRGEGDPGSTATRPGGGTGRRVTNRRWQLGSGRGK